MTGYYWLILVAFTAFLTAVGVHRYVWPKRWSWPQSTAVADGPNQGSTGTFWDWWTSQQSELGQRRTLKLDYWTRCKIDRVTDALQDEFIYRLDPPDVDFESVTADTRLGDCEDYARVAALMLKAHGLDLGTMALAFGQSQTGFGWHCVLWLDTDGGAYVLSVGDRFARPWAEFPIERASWQRAGNDGFYYALRA